ncbi:oligoendopeptidase F [Halobacteroides halobius DSM 5150]|uniref:Oligopeptidase F n=1 Tax=Halobacteroides halobius (strain ATCC 35273 / DSM 5150 / MD-1) TaxID=748449 RepID=L0KAM0_HALHC|nr:oligoendopeptidase F [Halobacteroides halobius]AGB41595.1 oligoendopeptidase F [Halobacteroides halobius DSM 5150]
MAQGKGLPTRDEINDQFKWDLTDVYQSEEEWKEEFNQVKGKVAEIKKYQGQLGNSAEDLLQLLNLSTQLSRVLARLFTYAQRKNDQDTTNNQYQALVSKIQGLSNQVSSATAFIVPEIIQIPVDKLEEFLANNEDLKLYQQYLDDIIRRKEHFLSPEEERIMALTGELAQGPENIFGMINNADMEFPTIENEAGEEVKVTHGRYVELLKSDSRQVRKDVFEAYYEQYQKQKNTIATTLSTNIKKDLFRMRARDYSSCLEAALDANNIPVEVYNNLLKTVKGNLDPMYDYVDLKREALGVDELHIYDLYTPLVKDVEMKIDYKEAKEIVLEALQPLGDKYLEVVNKAFESNWIDVYENKGKRSGAYSAGCYDAHPYILLNYTGEMNDLFTLTHELGHALHSYYSNQEQPYLYSDYSIFVAEVASTVNESLLIQHLLKKTDDETKKKYLLNHYLEQFRGTVYRQTMFADYEQLIHQLAEEGEALTPNLLSKRYHNLNEKYYGDNLVIDDKIDIEWARIPHFYYNFYVYQYATGFSAAVALSEQILEEENKAVESYLEFLKSGSSDYPLEILKKAGVDMSSPEPIEKAVNIFADSVGKMKELI